MKLQTWTHKEVTSQNIYKLTGQQPTTKSMLFLFLKKSGICKEIKIFPDNTSNIYCGRKVEEVRRVSVHLL